jgi:hypothetical protein
MKHLLGGLVLICLGIWGVVSWWDSFGLVMRGLVPFLALVLGPIAIVSGLRRLSTSTEVFEADGTDVE